MTLGGSDDGPMTHRLASNPGAGDVSKVSPSLAAERAMAMLAKYVDATPSVAEGGYSPMTDATLAIGGAPCQYQAATARP